MLTGGPLDVLTGDYLAELTMLILGRDRLKDPTAGYAKTFLRQLRKSLGIARRERTSQSSSTRAASTRPGLADRVEHWRKRLACPTSMSDTSKGTRSSDPMR